MVHRQAKHALARATLSGMPGNARRIIARTNGEHTSNLVTFGYLVFVKYVKGAIWYLSSNRDVLFGTWQITRQILGK